jgi:hypothetical protein
MLTGVDAAECQIEMARSKVLIGEPASAVTIAEHVLADLGSRPETTVTTIRARLMLAQALIATSDREASLTALRAARDELAGLETSRATARVWRELGDLFGTAEDATAMMDAYRKALESAGLRSSPQHSDIVVNLH